MNPQFFESVTFDHEKKCLYVEHIRTRMRMVFPDLDIPIVQYEPINEAIGKWTIRPKNWKRDGDKIATACLHWISD